MVREQCRRIASLGGKAGGVASVVAKGMVPYGPATPGRVGEIEFAFRLAADPLYRGPVRANFGKIAEKVNEVFHVGIPHYTRITLKVALQRHRRHQLSHAGSPADPEMSFTDSLARDPAYQFLARIKGEEMAGQKSSQYSRRHSALSPSEGGPRCGSGGRAPFLRRRFGCGLRPSFGATLHTVTISATFCRMDELDTLGYDCLLGYSGGGILSCEFVNL